MPAVELCSSALKSLGTCIARHQQQIQCCGRISAAGHRHFMRPTEQSQHVFICTTGLYSIPPASFSSRHNFCGHTSEFPASTFATADQPQRYPGPGPGAWASLPCLSSAEPLQLSSTPLPVHPRSWTNSLFTQRSSLIKKPLWMIKRRPLPGCRAPRGRDEPLIGMRYT